MPNIEITREQAEALARGEDVTVSAPKPTPKPLHHYIVAFTGSGNVYEIESREPLVTGPRVSFTKPYVAVATLVRRGTHHEQPGYVQDTVMGDECVVTEVPAPKRRGR